MDVRKATLAGMLALVIVGLTAGVSNAQEPGQPPARRGFFGRMARWNPFRASAVRVPDAGSEEDTSRTDDGSRKSKEWSTGRNLPAPKPWMQSPPR